MNLEYHCPYDNIALLFDHLFSLYYVGDQEVAALHPQTNATEPDNPRIWSAASVVQIPITRERHGQMLKCVAIHDSYDSGDHTEAVSAKLDVKCTLYSCLLLIL